MTPVITARSNACPANTPNTRCANAARSENHPANARQDRWVRIRVIASALELVGMGVLHALSERKYVLKTMATIHNPSRLHLEARFANLANEMQQGNIILNWRPTSLGQSPSATGVKDSRRKGVPRCGGTCITLECISSHAPSSIYFWLIFFLLAWP